MNDTPQLLALMQKTRDMRAYDCVKEFEALAYKLEKENIALQKEIKSVLDALNTAANEGGFDGYDEDTPLLVNLKSHWDRLYMTYDKELQRLYSMVSQRDAVRAENAALRADKERLDWLESLHCLWEGTEKTGPVFLTRDAIDAARKEVQP